MADVVIKPAIECEAEDMLGVNGDIIIAMYRAMPGFYGTPMYKASLEVEQASLRDHIYRHPKGRTHEPDNGFKGMGTLDAKQDTNYEQVTVLCLDGSEVTIPGELIYPNDGD